MALKSFLQRINVAKLATILLAIYAVSLTAVVVFATLIGPFKDEINLIVKNRTLEAELRASGDTNRGFQAERDKLVMNIKNLQNDLEISQATVKALRKSVDETSIRKDLAEANQMVDKLNKERAILAAKLDSLQKELQNIANPEKPKDNKKAAIETINLVTSLEKEKADLQAKVKELEGELKK